jgi:hypothetical protein
MKAVPIALHRSLRLIAGVLSVTLVFNLFAHATHVPRLPKLEAAQTPTPPPGPVPTQIAAARTVFLVNDGADPNFPMTGDQSYGKIYAALQAWGHYQLVNSPEQADLVFQLREIAPITAVNATHGQAYSIASPAFQLSIKDPKSNVTLWTITSPVELAGFKKARARWLNVAITNLVSRVKVLANQPLSEAESADLTLAPHRYGGSFALILGGVLIGTGVATGLILKHEFDKSVANQNTALCAQNPAFCTNP